MTEMRYAVPCSYCGEMVDAFDRTTFVRIIGWEKKGKSGGSDIVLRQRMDEWAHPHCVDKAKKKIPIGQGTLDDPAA